MADLDRADLLAKQQELLNRPASDEALTSAIWYSLMTGAQKRAFNLLLVRAPDAMYGIPTALTTADSGATYTFGSGVYPVGHAQIYATRSGIPDSPLEEGLDYIYEGSLIRIPNGRTRTFSDGGPWGRWVSLPGVIDGSTEPTLVKPARMLIVYDACRRAARRLYMDSQPFEDDFQGELMDVFMVLKTAVRPNMRSAGGTRRYTRSGGVVP